MEYSFFKIYTREMLSFLSISIQSLQNVDQN